MNTELILKEMESAYGRKKQALGKGMTKTEMKTALRDGAYRIVFPADDEDAAWYDLIRFHREELLEAQRKELEDQYIRIRALVVLGDPDAAKEFLLS